MKISSVVYVILGLFISLFSWLVNRSTNSKKLILFFYIGIIIIVFGLIKYFILRKSSKEKIKAKIPAQTKFWSYCPKCRQQVNIFDNFCSRCGMYLKARK